MKNVKGITLIALVITIIVLLILAGVSISAISGENGIVSKAKEASERTKEEEQKELAALEVLEGEIDKVTNEEEEEKLEVNEYGFYYNTFYVGTVYNNVMKQEANVAIYFIKENNFCFYYMRDSNYGSLEPWIVDDGKIIICDGVVECVIKNADVIESGTNCSVIADKDYKIVATKNEKGTYYGVAYFLQNTEANNSVKYGDCIASYITLYNGSNFMRDNIWSDHEESGSYPYSGFNYTISDDGKTLVSNELIYKIPEELYDLQ